MEREPIAGRGRPLKRPHDFRHRTRTDSKWTGNAPRWANLRVENPTSGVRDQAETVRGAESFRPPLERVSLRCQASACVRLKCFRTELRANLSLSKSSFCAAQGTNNIAFRTDLRGMCASGGEAA